jgi:hypothetical protein
MLKKTIILKKTRSSKLDKIFDFAEVEIEIDVKYSFHGGCAATYTQPEEYPEAEYGEILVKKISFFPFEEDKNNKILEHLELINILSEDIKKEIEKLSEEYVLSNWRKGENIESEVLQQASDEYQSYLEGWADVD